MRNATFSHTLWVKAGAKSGAGSEGNGGRHDRKHGVRMTHIWYVQERRHQRCQQILKNSNEPGPTTISRHAAEYRENKKTLAVEH